MNNLFKTKVFTIFCIVLICFLGFMIFQSRPIIESLDTDIDELKNRITESDRKTEQLESDFEYFESEAYLERQARLKLGLKDPEESVAYIVRDGEEIASNSEDIEEKSFWSNLIDKIFKRDQYSGSTLASQARNAGPIPVSRSCLSTLTLILFFGIM